MKATAKRNPFEVILRRYVTEKATVLQGLEHAKSNPSVARCQNPKAVFVVHPDANKHEIAGAIETIYRDRGIKVVKVNVSNVKPKQRRVRGRLGFRAGFKKAVVTLAAGDQLESV